MERLKYLPFYLFSLLPFWFIYALSDLTCFVLYHIVKYRREVVRANMSHSFPQKNEEELKKMEKAFYKHFCDQMFESIKVLSISEQEAKRRFTIKNPELIEQYYKEGRGIMLYSGHFGNWEWTSFLPLHFSHQLTAFYKPLSNRYYDGIIKLVRQRFGLVCIESKKGFKTLAELKQNGVLTMSLLLSDQSPGKDTPKEWVDFLNQNTAFVLGAHRIAKKLDQVLLFPSFKKPKRGHYELEFIPITDSPGSMETKEAVMAYANTLEAAILTSPSLWLWSHRRWKLKEPQA
jgi:KDO2-lipid IV(A) lauroyltransferase